MMVWLRVAAVSSIFCRAGPLLETLSLVRRAIELFLASIVSVPTADAVSAPIVAQAIRSNGIVNNFFMILINFKINSKYP